MLRHSMADQSGARFLRVLGRNTKGEWQGSSGLGCNSELKCEAKEIWISRFGCRNSRLDELLKFCII